MGRILRYLRYILNTVLGAALIISVLLLVLSFKSPFRSLYIYKVMSGSMEPAIHTGSIVIASVTKASGLKVGDVISYTMKNDETVTVTHRLVSINGNNGTYTFRTKGDANKTADLDEISANRLKGKVIATVPLLGYFFEWVKTPVGFLCTVVAPALYILISEAFVMKKIFERSAVEKYKREEEAISKYLALLISCSVLFGVLGIGKTQSYFSDGAVFSQVSIGTSRWAPPCKPALVSPQDKDVLPAGTVFFAWTGCTGGEVSYSLQIADNNNFKKIFDEKNSLSDSSVSVELPHGSYWWHVKACSDAVCGDWSDAWKITVIPAHNQQAAVQEETVSGPELNMNYNETSHEINYSLTGVGNFNRLRYELTYKSGELDEGLQGMEHINRDAFDGKILLGTCSDSGCRYDENISAVHITIHLYTKNDGQELVLTESR